jgi:hypothetical protein
MTGFLVFLAGWCVASILAVYPVILLLKRSARVESSWEM